MRMLVACLLCAATAGAADKEGTGTFSAPKDKVYAAAMTVIAADSIRINQADAGTGFITYTKWFSKALAVKVDVSVSLFAVEGGTKVIVATPNGGLRKKTLRAIAQQLHEDGAIPAAEIPKN